MSVNDLINQLGHLENNFVIGCYSLNLVAKNHPDLFSYPMKIGSKDLDPSRVKKMQSEQSTMITLINEYSKSCVRTLIREATEVITTYVYDTDQYQKIKYDDTFNFARIIRNSFSHNYVISYSDFYKRILETRNIAWNGKVFTLAVEGDALTRAFFSYEDAVSLFNDLRDMCRNTFS